MISGPRPIPLIRLSRFTRRRVGQIVLGLTVAGNSPTGKSVRCVEALEPELALVAACLRWPPDWIGQESIRNCARQTLDWERFLGQVTRHRVTSLVFENLRCAFASSVPPAIIGRLADAARSEARITMRQIAETARVTRMLAQAGIGVLVLKGPVLSVVAFGGPFRRDSRDIDLIVQAEELDRVDTILSADGYERRKPEAGLSAGQLATYRRWVHEFSYHSPARKVVLEVKDRVDPIMSLPAAAIIASIRRPTMVGVGGMELPTLSHVNHFLYLCAHGSRHSWFRLKWVADIGALLCSMSPHDLDVVSRRAAELNLGHCLHTALLLARELLQAPVPEAMLAPACADSGARRSEAAALRCINTFGSEGDPLKSFAFTARLFQQEYRLRSDWQYRRKVLQRHAISYAYPLLRPFMRMAKKLHPLP
jgi:hypothetical protein